MIKKFGDLHKLRVLTFDSGDTKENVVCKGETCKRGHNYTQNFKRNFNCSTNGFIGKCSKWMKTKSSSETSFKEGSSRNNRIRYIFKRQSNQSKRPITKRSVSLYDLKRNLSSTSISFTNPIRRSFKTITEKSLKRKQDKYNHYNKTDVQVLFMSETRKVDRRRIKSNISDDKRKLDWVNNSKSSDFFNNKSNQDNSNKKNQWQKKNRLFKYFYHNQNVCKLKQSKMAITDPVRITDYNNHLNLKPCGNTMHMRYNLVDFSCPSCKIESPFSECIHKISTIDTSPYLNKQVWVTPPCQNACRKCSGDSDNPKISTIDTSPYLNKQVWVTPPCQNAWRKCSGDSDNPKISKNTNIKKIQEKEPCKRCLSKDQKSLPSCEPTFTNSPESLAKLALKYFLIVIAIVVWAPCILLMCIYWVVTYPSRPLTIVEKMNLSTDNMIGCCDGCGRNCCERILNSFTIFSDKVTSSYNTIFGLLKKQKSQECQSLKTCVVRSSSNKNCIIKTKQNLCPNPKNKYTLYYTHHRGWIMKPFKKRRRPSLNKRCECNIEEFPSSKEKSEKKVMRDQYCECFPGKLKDNIISKTIKSISRQTSQKDHLKASKVVSQKTPPMSNNNDALPPKICCTDASTMPSSNLILNKNCHQSCESDEIWQIKPRKNVSFERKHLDLSGPQNPQIMSPRLKHYSPFYPNTLHKEYVPSEPFQKNIRGRTPCPCQQIKKISSRIYSKRPIPSQQNFIRSKYTNTEKGGTASRPNIKPKLSYHKYRAKEKKLPQKNNIRCLCKSVRKNVNEVVRDVECEVWKYNSCKDMYIYTLRRRPCFWVYKRCPSFYPYFLIFYRFYENVVIGLLFIISSCIWVPILCWCYVCFALFCRCTKC